MLGFKFQTLSPRVSTPTSECAPKLDFYNACGIVLSEILSGQEAEKMQEKTPATST